MNTRIGLTRCEHCGRQFNPHSAARHIPWCAKQKSDSKKQSLSHEKRQALERYKWRIGYRPSNQIQQQQQPPMRIAVSNGYKKNNSFHSTGTQSSPSASSSASIGTSVNSGGDGRGRGRVKQHNNTPHQTRHTIISRPPRSISSLSLGGHQQTLSSRSVRKSDSQDTMEVVVGESRAKSVSDISSSDMNSIVESLAKRMDQIYKQNQILLASLSMANLSRKSGVLDSEDTGNPSDDLDDEQEARSGSSNCEEQSKCHHCRAQYLPEALYCHKCGCKLFDAASRSATPG